MSEVITVQDLETLKKHEIFEAEVLTGKVGGLATGADIDYATNQVTGQVQKTMPAILRDIGFTPAAFDFTSGGTLGVNDRDKAVLWPLPGGDGDWYYWEGALPKVIPAASTPYTTGGVANGAWRPVGDITLREDLAAGDGSGLVGFTQGGTGALPRTALDKMREGISLSDFAVGTGTETTALNNAMAQAIATGKVIDADKDVTVSNSSVSPVTTNVPMVGRGTINGVYRKLTTPALRNQYVPVNTINPSAHLKKMGNTDAPVVVIMGDSISTDGPDSLCMASSMWSLICEKLQKDNPQKTFTFHNRAIGGQTWAEAADAARPAVGVQWWYTVNQPWLDYIEDLQPDVVFFGFGMNDSKNFNPTYLINVIVTKIGAWAKVPDVIFITNPVPAQTTIYPDGNGTGFRGEADQEGRDYVAGFERSFANYFNYGVIDINRAMVAMRDCYDVDAGPLKQIANPFATHYTAVTPAADFAFYCAVDPNLWPVGNRIKISCGRSAADSIYLTNEAGKIRVNAETFQVPNYVNQLTDFTIPTGVANFILEVSVSGGIGRVIAAPTYPTVTSRRVICQFKVVRHGGIFYPAIGWDTDINDGPFVQVTYLSGYSEAKYRQTLLDSDIWGPSDSSTSIKPIWGGNGINHYTARGIDYLVRPVIEACDFRGVGTVTTGVHAGGRWVKYPDGTSTFSKRVPMTVNINQAAGGVFVMPAGIADTDFPPIFMVDSGPNLSFEVSLHVYADIGVSIWPVTSGTSSPNNAIRYKLASATTLSGYPLVVHITMRGRWK